MLTLSDLLENACVQGNVRISTWKEDCEEVVIRTFDETEYVPYNDRLLKKWQNAEVIYMFAARDGFLHIEVKEND